MWDEFFFWLRSGSTLCACVTPLSGKAAGTGRKFFFVNFDFICLVSYTLPWIMIPFIPTFFSPPIFFTETHTQEHLMYENIKKTYQSSRPPSYDFVMCVKRASEPNAISLSSLHNRSHCNLYERFSVWLWNRNPTNSPHIHRQENI